MGACSFITYGKGETARDAFDALVAQAEWEHGHYPYNGTISTTKLVGRMMVSVADEWCDEARVAAEKIADADDWGEKWESRAIDCGKCDDGQHMFAFYGWASC